MTEKYAVISVGEIKLIDIKTGEEIKPVEPKEIVKLYNKDKNMVNLDSVHKLIDVLTADKEIELNKTYWASEWSWTPICDGISPYEQTIRSHMVVDGVDVYFTDTNFRIYLKEDLFETKDSCKKMCDYKNSFGYDYEVNVDRKINIRKKLKSVNMGNKVEWVIKES